MIEKKLLEERVGVPSDSRRENVENEETAIADSKNISYYRTENKK